MPTLPRSSPGMVCLQRKNCVITSEAFLQIYYLYLCVCVKLAQVAEPVHQESSCSEEQRVEWRQLEGVVARVCRWERRYLAKCHWRRHVLSCLATVENHGEKSGKKSRRGFGKHGENTR